MIYAATIFLSSFLLFLVQPLIARLILPWFGGARPVPNPYRLFAISNLASLLALVGYPFVFEPFLTAREQVKVWSWLFVLFALLCAAVAWRTPRVVTEPASQHDVPEAKQQ